jgi:hypothetical protein
MKHTTIGNMLDHAITIRGDHIILSKISLKFFLREIYPLKEQWQNNAFLSSSLGEIIGQQCNCKIWGFHGGDYEESSFLGCDTV